MGKPAVSGAWGDRRALLFIAVSLVSGFGGTVMTLVAGIWVLSLTGSSSLAALASLGVYLPAVVAPVLGAMVDRFPRRPLLVWTNTVTGLAVLTLLTIRSAEHVWLIYAVMLGYGVCLVLVDAGDAALLPAVLPDESLGTVNGLRVSAQEGTKLVAPLLGAALFAWRGGPAAVTVTTVALLVTAALYVMIGREKPANARTASDGAADGAAGDDRRGWRRSLGGGLAGEVRDGIAFLRRTRVVRAPVLVGSVAIAMSGFGTAGWYAVVTQELHRPPTVLGVLTSLQGVGSILGGVLAGRLMKRHGELAVGAIGAIVFGLGAASQATAWWPAVLAGSVLVGVGLPWTLLAAVTTVQRRTPHALLGRVSATANTLLFAPVAITTPLGAATVLLGHRLPLILTAMSGLAAGSLLLRSSDRKATVDAG